ncbi:MAG TPA: hybrid sensor histidine kinase/response regulator [Polyangiaceae bacterium]|nr:hybrid sensor histidine kinase/response regulator [Polyangiaceae bacterium]
MRERDRSGEPPEPEATSTSRVRGALHDVSNALTVLLGWVEEAQSPDATRDEVRAALRVVEAHARRARDLARWAVGGDGAVEPSPARCDAVVDEALAGLAMAAREAGVALAVDGHAGGAAVCAPEALHHVLVNLVLNALAFSPRGGLVTVALEARAASVVLAVSDEGRGVAAPAEVFTGRSDRAGGSGVGLAHSRSVARGLGGDLELDPGGPGATFRLTWPRADETPRPSGTSVRGGGSLAGRRILVVEDDPAVLSLLEAALGARGAEVVVAVDRVSLDAALTERHHGVVLDLSPLEGHLEDDLARIAAAGLPGAPIVLATGAADRVPAALVGALRLVRKPFELGEVLEALAAPTV